MSLKQNVNIIFYLIFGFVRLLMSVYPYYLKPALVKVTLQPIIIRYCLCQLFLNLITIFSMRQKQNENYF